MGGFFYIDIIVLGLVSLVLIFALYRLLGQRVGFQVVSAVPADVKGKMQVLREIQAADPNFSEKKFLDGARKAYKIVTDAFYAQDMKTLRALLTQRVYRAFSESKPGPKKSFEVMSAEIEDKGTGIENKTVSMSVGFVVKVQKVTMRENWIFERPLSSHSPIWLLARTNPPEKIKLI